jgi:hypothetical protein
MIRILTLILFLGTPLATALTWALVSPYAAIGVLVALPVVSVLAAALSLRSRGGADSLAAERERLRSDLR